MLLTLHRRVLPWEAAGASAITYHRRMSDVLPQQALLRQAVACVVRHGVHGALLNLVLDGLVQQEQ